MRWPSSLLNGLKVSPGSSLPSFLQKTIRAIAALPWTGAPRRAVVVSAPGGPRTRPSRRAAARLLDDARGGSAGPARPPRRAEIPGQLLQERGRRDAQRLRERLQRVERRRA